MPEKMHNGSGQQNPTAGAPSPLQQQQQQFAAQQQAAAAAAANASGAGAGAHGMHGRQASAAGAAGGRPPAGARRPVQGQVQGQGVPMAGPGGIGGGAGNGGKAGASGAKPRNRKVFVGVCVAAIVVILVSCGIIFATGIANNAFFDSSAKEGQASYKTPEEIEAERNRQMKEGMLNISMASIIKFANGTAPGTAYIENVPSNKYVMKVTITIDNTGEVVYQSGGIKPNSVIDTITLSQPLAAGTYPATATFSAYNPDSLEEIGQAAAKVTLVVEN